MPNRRSLHVLAICTLGLACTSADGDANTDGETDTTGTGTNTVSTSAGSSTSPPSSGPSTASTGPSTGPDTDDSTTGPTNTGSEVGSGSESGMTETETGTETGSGAACEDHGSYDLAFSTYFGGADDWEHARGITVGPDGSIYVVGGTASPDFPTTAGAYDQTYNGGGGQVGQGGDIDVFVAKFSPDGQLDWSTFVGSPNYDRAYTVRVDAEGFVYFGGRAGPGFPTTQGSFQPTYAGFNPGFYGQQNAFMAKLSPDGSDLVWASYVGIGALVRTFDLDEDGDIYASLSVEPGSTNNQPGWMDTAFDGAFQPTPGSATDNGVVKIAGDGTAVMWATWLGGSGDERPRSTVRVDGSGRPHVLVPTTSDDLPTTAGAWHPNYLGNEDLYLARLSADGSTLEVGTYIGGSDFDEIETHGLGLSDDSIYVGFYSASTDIETTAGAFQPNFGGGALDTVVARLDNTGALVAATYVGGDGGDSSDGFDVTPSGDVVLVGESNSTNFPTSPDAFQDSLGGMQDGTVVRLSPDLSTLVYGTYIGGPNRENLRTSTIDGDCSVLVAGAADGTGFPTINAMQPNFAGGMADFGNGDNIIARFDSVR